MPTLSGFYGILIRMFFNDHPPPHFNARYGEEELREDRRLCREHITPTKIEPLA
jgi:hypothetical protein